MAKIGEDCYYYFYSTCNKGSACPYRHCEAAKGSEVVCGSWERGHCTKPNCQFRHFVMDKNRSNIKCYWEQQPGGCQKPHCVFQHSKPKPLVGGKSGAVKPTKETELPRDAVTSHADNGESETKAGLVSSLSSHILSSLGGGEEQGCLSDSELVNKKRKRDAESGIVQNSDNGRSTQFDSHSEKVAVTNTRKILLRKPTSDLSAKQSVESEPETKKKRTWRRKSVSPKLKDELPDQSISTTVEEPKDLNVDSESKALLEKKMQSSTGIGIDEEYKAKLIDIFGPSLADVYLSQGIKLDLSQYPSK